MTEPTINAKVVLVVEDEPALVSIYKRALLRQGYQVLTASNGEEALEIASDSSLRIDLLISDIVMPGISGRELVWRIRETRPETQIILASGYANQHGALQMMEDQNVVFVAKPLDLGDLMAVVNERIGAATE